MPSLSKETLIEIIKGSHLDVVISSTTEPSTTTVTDSAKPRLKSILVNSSAAAPNITPDSSTTDTSNTVVNRITGQCIQELNRKDLLT